MDFSLGLRLSLLRALSFFMGALGLQRLVFLFHLIFLMAVLLIRRRTLTKIGCNRMRRYIIGKFNKISQVVCPFCSESVFRLSFFHHPALFASRDHRMKINCSRTLNWLEIKKKKENNKKSKENHSTSFSGTLLAPESELALIHFTKVEAKKVYIIFVQLWFRASWRILVHAWNFIWEVFYPSG